MSGVEARELGREETARRFSLIPHDDRVAVAAADQGGAHAFAALGGA